MTMTATELTQDVCDWLMAGDPIIRWQTQRDLLEEPASIWEDERRKTLETGWGAQFLSALRPDGTWPEARWTGAVWTLPQLIDCGLPADHPPLRASAQRFIDHNLTEARAKDEHWLLNRMDLCHLGFWLRIGSYFLGQDERLASTAKVVMAVALPDGGFNCRVRNEPDTQHSSFHTTFNVLEGLAAAVRAGNIDAESFRVAEMKALDFMLEHQLYRSERTGDIVDVRFTHLTYPSHWHYTVLRGLDYIRETAEIGDQRLADPVALVESRRKPSGRWIVEKRIPGVEHFDMEKWGSESRWTTLKALRVLKARESATTKRKPG